MKYLYKEDFSDFPLDEFPYDINHSALGEYHTFTIPGYTGNFYDPISLHQWRSKDGSWLVTSDGTKNYMEQNRANEVSGAFLSCYPLLVLKDYIYKPYTINSTFLFYSIEEYGGLSFLYQTSRNLYALLFKENEIKVVYRYDETFTTLASKEFKTEALKEYRVKIDVGYKKVIVYVNDLQIFDLDIIFRIGKVGLISKVATRYYNIDVLLTDEMFKEHLTAKEREINRQETKIKKYPSLKLINKINLGNFASGRQLRIARYNNKTYFLLAQHQKRIMRDSFARLSCLTCFDYEGNILWQKGKPQNDINHTLISCDLPFQVADINGDKKLEVVYSMDFKIYVVDLLTGKLIKEGLPPIIYKDPLVKNEPFYYLNLDGLRVADFEGLGYRGNLVVKDRYQNVYALDENFKVMWRYHHKNTGHFPYIYDFNNDGKDEMFVGYDYVSSKGEIIWSAPYNSDHTDEIIYTNLEPNGKKYLVLASGNEGMNVLDMNGNVYKHNEIGHAQRISVADYDLNRYGYEIITTAFWGSPGITRTYDYQGNIIAEKEFLSNGNLVAPVMYDGVNTLCLLNASEIGGLMDSNLDIVVKFPLDNHPSLCAEVFDIDGDGIDEIICWDLKEMWFYKASSYVKPKYEYDKYSEDAFSNYRGEFLVKKGDNDEKKD